MQLYLDELGTTNPLRASSAKTYKIMACYFRILNLPPDMQAYLKHIFCLFISQSVHILDNFQANLYHLLHDLRKLEETGLKIAYRGREQTMKVVILNCSGDNLGIHQFIGWNLHWVGDSICRMCDMSYADIVSKSSLTSATMRTKEQYNRVINDRTQWQKYGIRSICSANKFKYFHCMDPFYADIVHDLFEGHLQYFIP